MRYASAGINSGARLTALAIWSIEVPRRTLTKGKRLKTDTYKDRHLKERLEPPTDRFHAVFHAG
jgi:hypothetical protein